jgi:hypothetical protein
MDVKIFMVSPITGNDETAERERIIRIRDDAEREKALREWLETKAHLFLFERELTDSTDSPLVTAFLDTAKKHYIRELDLHDLQIIIILNKEKQPEPQIKQPKTLKPPATRPPYRSHGPAWFENRKYNSLHAFCVDKGVKYNGEPNALDAVELSKDVRTGDPFPDYRYHVTTVDGREVHYVDKTQNSPGKIVDEDGNIVGEFLITKINR